MLSRIHAYLTLGLGVLAVALVLWCMFLRTSASNSDLRAAAAVERADALAAQVIRADEIIKAERAKAQQMAAIAEQYEQDKTYAQADADKLAADLRAGNVRLRDEWAGCATDRVSQIGTSAAELDAAEQRRREGARDLVQIAEQWDAKERALQAVVRADRE